MNKIEILVSRWVLNHRVILAVVSLILVGLASAGGRFLYFENDYRAYFSDDNPELIAFEELETTYTKNDNVLFAIAPNSGDVFDSRVLKLVEELTEASWQIPHSIRVDSISNFQHTEAENDDLVVGDLIVDAANLDDQAIASARDIALTDPVLRNLLISDRGQVTGINVTIQVPGKDKALEGQEVVASARAILTEFRQQYPDIDLRPTGSMFMSAAFDEAATKDLMGLVPLSFAVMFLVMALLVGGFWGTLIALVVVMLSVMSGMGLGGYAGFPITAPSSVAPTVILTVAMANCVHVLSIFRDQMCAGSTRMDAATESLRVNLQPVLLATLTTSVGFLTLNFSDVPPFRHLGCFVAFGVLFSGWLALTLLPALLSVVPIRFKAAKSSQLSQREIWTTKLADFVIRRRSTLLISMSLIVVLLASAIPRNELNDVFVHYFDDSIAFRVDTDFTTANLTGIYNVHFDLRAAEEGGVSDPRFLEEVEAFANWARIQPHVLHVGSVTDIFKRLNKNMHGDDEDYYRLPEKRDLAAQYLLLYEMSLPYGLDLNNQFNIDKSSTRFTVTTETISTKEFLALSASAEAWLDTNAPNITHSGSTSTGDMFAKIGDRNIKSMLIGTTVALILISVMLAFALRSVKIGLISLVPNLVPAAMGFGLWGIMIGEVGLSLSVVTSMTLGIVVDDTVHFLSKYLRARREHGLDAADAVRYAFKTVGMALVVTTVVLVAGFLVLSTSAFQLNSGAGMLTSIVISLALLADFLLLPPLLIALDSSKNQSHKGKQHEENIQPAITAAQ